jgi:hypothetical protein
MQDVGRHLIDVVHNSISAAGLMKRSLWLTLFIVWCSSESPTSAQVLAHPAWPSVEHERRLAAQVQEALPLALPGPALWRTGSSDEFSGGQYLGMFAAGTLGSAAGLLAGLVGAAAITVVSTGCIDCGVPPLAYVIPVATTSLATSAAVASVARPPTVLEFGPGLREVLRSDVFRPALIGAAAGIATGALFGIAVERVSPPDQPYPLIAFNIGQSAASVLAVRIWTARKHP